MIESIFYLVILGVCAIFSFKAGKKSNSNKVIEETLDWLIDEGYLKYDEKNDQLIRYDE
jgi:hypothetical protein